MARAKQPVSVGGIEFDALIDSEEGYEADVPEYPTEKGFSVSDTIVLKADTLSMTLYVTDTPVTWKDRTGSGPGKTEGVVRRLKDLYFSKQVLEVTTSDCVYSNMVITSMSIKKATDVGYAREIPIALRRSTSPKQQPQKYRPATASRVKQGKPLEKQAQPPQARREAAHPAVLRLVRPAPAGVLFSITLPAASACWDKEGVRGLLRYRSPGHERQRCEGFPPKQAVSAAFHME